jgi:protein FAM32A
MPTAFTGGALSFKGEKKKKKKAKKKESQTKHKLEKDGSSSSVPVPPVVDPLDDMTPAERRAMERKKERLRIDNEKLAQKSHRERIEAFNEKLGSATEHNDIPRVSAAGNG